MFFRQLKKRKLFLIILFCLIFFSSIGIFAYKAFTENKLTKVDVNAENLNCTTSDEITSFIRGLNLNYFYYKKELISRQLSQKFFCIGSIESEVSYPDKIKLKIAGRQGKFVAVPINTKVETNPTIKLSLGQLNATQSTSEAFPPKVLSEILKTYKEASESAFYLVDEEGMVFQETSTDVGLPKLSIFGKDLKLGQKIPDDIVKKAAQVFEKLEELQVYSGSFLVVGDRLIIDANPRITFSLNRPIDRQSASLQLILRQAKMNSVAGSSDTKSVESVDLRFDRPVVVYSKK